jgi:cytidine deaminase
MLISEVKLQELKEAAVEASRHAYCPYSGFPVGAAVLAKSGDMYSGCNVENASFGLTMCAERNAIFQAAAAGVREIVVVAIYTPTKMPSPSCGACRQVISEFGPDAEVVSFCRGKDVLRKQANELLPNGFRYETRTETGTEY